MEQINKKPDRIKSDKALKKIQEIESCLSLEVNYGYEILIEKTGSWKSSFYKILREKRINQERIIKENLNNNSSLDIGLDYINMDFTINSTKTGLAIWRNK